VPVVILALLSASGTPAAAGGPGLFLRVTQTGDPLLSAEDNITLERSAVRTQRGQLEVPEHFGSGGFKDYVGPIGRAGDWILLDPGEYTLSFAGPAAYRMRIGLAVGRQSVEIVGLEADGLRGECGFDGHIYVSEWNPSIRPLRPNGKAFELSIARPATVRRSQVRGCGLPSIFSPQATVGVSISSDPIGAEILVDGKAVGTTNDRINIPCSSAEKVNALVVLRKPGFANCIRKVTKDTGGMVSCKMVRAPAHVQ